MKMEGMAELNDRYMRLSKDYSENERELHHLRSDIRKLKSMNSGVDHLWQVKEEEYRNINEVLRGIYGN